jgi:hypothetical protein
MASEFYSARATNFHVQHAGGQVVKKVKFIFYTTESGWKTCENRGENGWEHSVLLMTKE